MKTKLKTLKDFSDKECYCDFLKGIVPLKKRRFILESKLKAEAVKKIEFLKQIKKNEIKRLPNGFGICGGNETEAIIGFLIWDNNLTEEEIKSKDKGERK